MIFAALRGRYLRQQRGAVAVEFAIVASLFFLLLFAILEFSLMFWANLTMQHAVREGARYAVTGRADLDPNEEQQIRERAVVEKIRESSMGLYDRVCSVRNTDFGTPQNITTINIDCSWPIVTPLIGSFFTGGEYSFTVSATMRNEAF